MPQRELGTSLTPLRPVKHLLASPPPGWPSTAFILRLHRFRADHPGGYSSSSSSLTTNFIFIHVLSFIFSHSRHFYLAVDRLHFKMVFFFHTFSFLYLNLFLYYFDYPKRSQQTVIELVDLVARRPCLPIVVCCSTRDDLDSLCSSLSTLPFLSSSALYSDLGEDERSFILEKFRQVTARWNQTNHGGAPNEDEIGKDERSHMIIVTDACLPLLASGEFPLNAHLLINYELPAKKETYGRRLATCLTAGPFFIT
ncbi:Eukaryotic initiation factor 4A isoform B [Glycine soja]|uniref:Eukaryotic initiation factor 4A isoform B n=1 Tax=Glycine soja TaxID=3848 RepID=A0A445M4Y6_GLYSO|nr:Eukaryotic initiation factor 4A isoform B [Glycine soja]